MTERLARPFKTSHLPPSAQLSQPILCLYDSPTKSALGKCLKANVLNPASHHRAVYLLAASIILLVVLTYWPVVHAGFVWDDVTDFQKTAWLRQGSDWQHLLLKNFNDWTNYFRPLVIALFTAEVRAFHVQPGPMHAFSLLLHLVNTLLVGALAVRITKNDRETANWLTSAIPMLLYGLHPLLIESVTWIGCQFDLTATLFMLLGLLLNASVRNPILRAMSVAASFFLAACSKESAAAFPLLLATFDWLAVKDPSNAGWLSRLKTLFIRNGFVYLFTFAAGVAYLVLRHWALGGLALHSGGDTLSAVARFQQACFLYLRYWRMFFWPMAGMGPLHPVQANTFYTINAGSLLQDIAAISVVLIGIVLTLQRSYLGGAIVAVTISLLPVLHIIPANVDSSLYHERYAIMGLAACCVLLPAIWAGVRIPKHIQPTIYRASLAILVAWLALSIVNIRQTIPLWSSQLALWQWAEIENPDYIGAKDELISAYIDAGDNAKAWQLINKMIANNEYCLNCFLNGASLAATQGDPRRTALLLGKIKNDPTLQVDRSTYRFYLTTQSKLLILENHPDVAEHLARQAIALDSLDPEPQLALAMTLALQGKFTEAQQAENSGIQLLAPEEHQERLHNFETLMSTLQTNAKAK